MYVKVVVEKISLIVYLAELDDEELRQKALQIDVLLDHVELQEVICHIFERILNKFNILRYKLDKRGYLWLGRVDMEVLSKVRRSNTWRIIWWPLVCGAEYDDGRSTAMISCGRITEFI